MPGQMMHNFIPSMWLFLYTAWCCWWIAFLPLSLITMEWEFSESRFFIFKARYTGFIWLAVTGRSLLWEGKIQTPNAWDVGTEVSGKRSSHMYCPSYTWLLLGSKSSWVLLKTKKWLTWCMWYQLGDSFFLCLMHRSFSRKTLLFCHCRLGINKSTGHVIFSPVLSSLSKEAAFKAGPVARVRPFASWLPQALPGQLITSSH